METTVRYGLMSALVAVAGVVQAAESFDPASRAEVIAPFIDEQTIAVAHVDLSRIKAEPLIDRFVELLSDAILTTKESRAVASQLNSTFRSEGFPEFFVVFSLADLPTEAPFLVAPMTAKSDLDALRDALREALPPTSRSRTNPGEWIQQLDGMLFLGSSRSYERIKRGKPHRRPELADAFRAAGDTAAQLLLLPTADDRRVIEELLPQLPQEVGGGPSTILTRGLMWAAVGANAPPETCIQLVVRSENNATAEAFRDKLVSGARAWVQRAEDPDSLRRFDAAATRLTPKVEGERLSLLLNEKNQSITALLAAFSSPLEVARARAARTRGRDRLKQLGRALHNWHDVHKSFPAQANFDGNGDPLLSWRVHILPYVDQRKLYNQFRLDEPWDSDHNKKLIKQMPDVYRSRLCKKGKEGYSSYVLPVGDKTAFPGRRGVPISEITDGTSNTIMVVEVDDDQAVVWTRPEDLPFDPENPAKGLGGLLEGGFQCTFCDGSAHFIKLPLKPETLRRLFMRADGKPVGDF